MALTKEYSFSHVQEEQTIARMFTEVDEDLLQYANDISKAYREAIHRSYVDRDNSDNWTLLYCKVQGFWVKLRSKKKAEFITVGIKPNAENGVLSPMSKAGAEVYNNVKPGKMNIEQFYIDLREGFTVIRTQHAFVCIYKNAQQETFACVVNRDVEPTAKLIDFILFTRSQRGVKNYGFSE